MPGNTKRLILRSRLRHSAGLIVLVTPGWMEVRPLRAHFIDVGYGDAILIEFQDTTTMLIDAGETRYSSRLMSYLKANQIRKDRHRCHHASSPESFRWTPQDRRPDPPSAGCFHNGDSNAEKDIPRSCLIWSANVFLSRS